MYDKILVALDASPTDEAIINHIGELAAIHKSHVILLRVAHYHTRDQGTHEVDESEEYMQSVVKRLTSKGIDVETLISVGEPADEIVRQAENLHVDLIAMSTHGHRGIYDLVLGSVAEEVRHEVSIPVLLIRSPG